MPNPLCGAVVSTKNTMMVPCMVISDRYSSGVITPPAAPVGQSFSNSATLASGNTMWNRISSERNMPRNTENSARK